MTENEKMIPQKYFDPIAIVYQTCQHVRGTTPSLASRLAMTQGQPRPNC